MVIGMVSTERLGQKDDEVGGVSTVYTKQAASLFEGRVFNVQNLLGTFVGLLITLERKSLFK